MGIPKVHGKARSSLAVAAALLLTLGLAGCEGSDGKDGADGANGATGATGPAGPSGPTGPTGPQGPGPSDPPTGQLTGAISSVTVGTNGAVTVTFSLKGATGLPVSGAKNFEFVIAKLIPATATKPAQWQSYINSSYSSTGGVRVLRAAGERAIATEVSQGVYRYTLCTPLATVASFKYYGSASQPATGVCASSVVSTAGALSSAAATTVLNALDVAYSPNAVHRIAVTARDTGARSNLVLDFVPSSLPNLLAAKANQVVTQESCGACHGESTARGSLVWGLHGGRRYDINLCVVCHNGSTYDSLGGSTDSAWIPVDLMTMAHKLHTPVTGYSVAGDDYSHVTYPQNGSFGGVQDVDGSGPYTAKPGVVNCRVCHDNQNPKILPFQPASRTAAEKDAWRANLSKQACGTCHVDATATSHINGFTDNTTCVTCHGIGKSSEISVVHATPFSSPNNPELMAGAKKVEYQISSLTVNGSNQPIVKFRILVDGNWINLKSLPTGIAIGAVNFRAAWSAPLAQPVLKANGESNGPAIAQPLDWNNFGGTINARTYFNNTTSLAKAAYDQPWSVNLSTSGVISNMTGPDGDGYFITAAGINPASPVAFPANSTLRGVAIESYLAISATVNGTATTLNLGGDAAVKGVDGVASTVRRQVVDINSCNTCHERVGFHSNAGRTNNPDHCVMCHNSEMSSSNTFAGTFTDGLVYSQKPNNFKEMIHGIHGAEVHTIPFNFIRGNAAGGSGGAGPHPFEEVEYPNALTDCGACHRTGTYAVPASTSYAWTVIDAEPALGATAGAFNPTLSLRQGPSAGACGSCHDDPASKAHFVINTAVSTGTESCNVCHGPGKSMDVAEVHK